MRTRINKADFIAATTNEINALTFEVNFVENELPAILEKFNGKVYNIRLANTVSEALLPSGYMAYKCDADKFAITIAKTACSWADSHPLRYNITLDENGRISCEQTLADNRRYIDGRKERIQTLRDAIANYDEYMRAAEKLDKMIEDYSENVPAEIRHIVSFSNYWYITH